MNHNEWVTPFPKRANDAGVAKKNTRDDAMDVDRTKDRKKAITCYTCGGQGHITKNCTKKTDNREA
jgi:hypothetical protein